MGTRPLRSGPRGCVACAVGPNCRACRGKDLAAPGNEGLHSGVKRQSLVDVLPKRDEEEEETSSSTNQADSNVLSTIEDAGRDARAF